MDKPRFINERTVYEVMGRDFSDFHGTEIVFIHLAVERVYSAKGYAVQNEVIVINIAMSLEYHKYSNTLGDTLVWRIEELEKENAALKAQLKGKDHKALVVNFHNKENMYDK